MSDATWAPVAANVPTVLPAGIVTEAGTESDALPEANVTIAPPAGAGWDNVTVQVVDPGVAIEEGVQAKPLTCELAPKVIEVLCDMPFAEAVTVAVEEEAIVPAVAEKLAEFAPAATVTEGGTVSTAEFEARVTTRPPNGAALLRVTVQLVAPPEVKADAAHETLETSAADAAADRVNEKFIVTPL